MESSANVVEHMVSNFEVREKSLKVFQYYATFLQGYYTETEPNAVLMRGASTMKNRFSLGRKAIRFLRCWQHLIIFYHRLKHIQSVEWDSLQQSYIAGTVEQLCLFFYFLGDNVLLMRICGIFAKSPWWEQVLYNGDFAADLAGIAHMSLTIYEKQEQRDALVRRYREIEWSDGAAEASEREDIKASLRDLRAAQVQCWVSMSISLLQTINSGQYPNIDLWKRIFGAPIPERIVGLSGVLSSSIVLLNALPEGTLPRIWPFVANTDPEPITDADTDAGGAHDNGSGGNTKKMQ